MGAETDARGEKGRGRTLRAGPLFWIMVLFAVGFARYFVLARRDDDRELTLAAAVAFVLMCVLAVAELFGWLW